MRQRHETRTERPPTAAGFCVDASQRVCKVAGPKNAVLGKPSALEFVCVER